MAERVDPPSGMRFGATTHEQLSDIPGPIHRNSKRLGVSWTSWYPSLKP
jgi:hypothetical protein